MNRILGIAEALGYSVLGFAIVFLMLIILMLIIVVLGKFFISKKEASAPAAKPAAPAPAAPVAPAVKQDPAPGTAGQVNLHTVDDKTAAMLMAIVADELQAPINELRFIDIKQI